MAKQTQQNDSNVIGIAFGVAATAAVAAVAVERAFAARTQWYAGDLMKATATVAAAEALESVKILKAAKKAEALNA